MHRTFHAKIMVILTRRCTRDEAIFLLCAMVLALTGGFKSTAYALSPYIILVPAATIVIIESGYPQRLGEWLGGKIYDVTHPEKDA